LITFLSEGSLKS